MRSSSLTVLTMALAICLSAEQSSAPNNLHLTTDQIAVYQAFLRSYATGPSDVVNLGTENDSA